MSALFPSTPTFSEAQENVFDFTIFWMSENPSFNPVTIRTFYNSYSYQESPEQARPTARHQK
jgi:hypothetical protein